MKKIMIVILGLITQSTFAFASNASDVLAVNEGKDMMESSSRPWLWLGFGSVGVSAVCSASLYKNSSQNSHWLALAGAASGVVGSAFFWLDYKEMLALTVKEKEFRIIRMNSNKIENKKTIPTLNSQQKSYEDQITTLSKSIQTQKESYEETISTMNFQEKLYEDQITNLSQNIQTQKESYEETISTMNSQEKLYEDQITSLSQNIQTLTSEKSVLTDTYNNLMSKHNALNQNIHSERSRMTQQYDALQALNLELETKCQSAADSLKQKEKDLTLSRSAFDVEKRKILAEAAQSLKKMESEKDKLSIEYEAACVRLKEKEAELACMSAQLAEVTQSLEMMGSEKCKLLIEYESASAQLRQKEEELVRISAENDEQKDEFSSYEPMRSNFNSNNQSRKIGLPPQGNLGLKAMYRDDDNNSLCSTFTSASASGAYASLGEFLNTTHIIKKLESISAIELLISLKTEQFDLFLIQDKANNKDIGFYSKEHGDSNEDYFVVSFSSQDVPQNLHRSNLLEKTKPTIKLIEKAISHNRTTLGTQSQHADLCAGTIKLCTSYFSTKYIKTAWIKLYNEANPVVRVESTDIKDTKVTKEYVSFYTLKSEEEVFKVFSKEKYTFQSYADYLASNSTTPLGTSSSNDTSSPRTSVESIDSDGSMSLEDLLNPTNPDTNNSSNPANNILIVPAT